MFENAFEISSSVLGELKIVAYTVGQGSATPGTRATGGTREDFYGTPSDLTRM